MVSLVTTVFNDRAGIELFFRRMAEQTRPPNEIVITDSISTDGTWAVIEAERAHPRGPWKVNARQERCNVARGRNLSIERAAHDLIVSTDIGCDWDPPWLAELAQSLDAYPACRAVMGSWAVRPQDLAGVWARVEYALLREPRFVARPESDASSRSIAYRRSLWKEIDGYPEDLTLAADDMVFSLLLHRTASPDEIACAPEVRCWWQRPETLRAFCKEARRNFRGAGEAGIWQDFGWKTGGRIAAEVFLLPAGFIFLLMGKFLIAFPVFALLLASLGLRLARLRRPVRIARKMDIDRALPRLFVFDWITKMYGVLGYWEGRRRGTSHCQNCRRQLRAAGV